ncbi:MAG: SDR family NAD(P)-dependent oxidoreductase [Rhodoferax sp.]|nr:MAG: SDR family NAD(P)-dependent oxidoreductase [Rhodoferax sp.]
MAFDLNQAPHQTGRTALVTGANIGLGYETAKAFAGLGGSVILACRNADKARAARDSILEAHPQAQVSIEALDLSDLASVRACGARIAESRQTLDLLLNNAGIMMPPYSLSKDGFESQMAANYLGHFVLTGLLLPLLNATPGARVVTLSSLAHRWGPIRFDDPHFQRGYDKRRAYGQSKLACLVFAFELHRRLTASGASTISVAAHPGVAATNLGQHLPNLARWLMPAAGLIFNSASEGALPSLYAALGQDIVGGDYCGPGGLGQMRGPAIKVGSSRTARDPEQGRRLWELSESLTGLRYLD